MEAILTPHGPLAEGDVVYYRPFGGGTRKVMVDEVSVDIKNGRPGFAGVLLDTSFGKAPSEYRQLDVGGYDHGVWGYVDQIEKVIRKNW